MSTQKKSRINGLNKISTIHYLLIVVILYYPSFGYADQSIVKDDGPAQAHLLFKVIIPESLSMSVSKLSQYNTQPDSTENKDQFEITYQPTTSRLTTLQNDSPHFILCSP